MAGIAGFKPNVEAANASAILLRDWLENDTFTWIMTADVVDEYAAVLAEFRVRSSIIGRVVNLLREEAEWIERKSSLSPVW